jgi:hypothetical protein
VTNVVSIIAGSLGLPEPIRQFRIIKAKVLWKERVMTYRGRVKNGVVVLDNPKGLPEGAKVTVTPLKLRPKTTKRKKMLSLYDRFKPFIGAVKGLPADLALNHDHYLHGLPKR